MFCCHLGEAIRATSFLLDVEHWINDLALRSLWCWWCCCCCCCCCRCCALKGRRSRFLCILPSSPLMSNWPILTMLPQPELERVWKENRFFFCLSIRRYLAWAFKFCNFDFDIDTVSRLFVCMRLTPIIIIILSVSMLMSLLLWFPVAFFHSFTLFWYIYFLLKVDFYWNYFECVLLWKWCVDVENGDLYRLLTKLLSWLFESFQ